MRKYQEHLKQSSKWGADEDVSLIQFIFGNAYEAIVTKRAPFYSINKSNEQIAKRIRDFQDYFDIHFSFIKQKNVDIAKLVKTMKKDIEDLTGISHQEKINIANINVQQNLSMVPSGYNLLNNPSQPPFFPVQGVSNEGDLSTKDDDVSIVQTFIPPVIPKRKRKEIYKYSVNEFTPR